MKPVLEGLVALLVIAGMVLGAISYFAEAEDLKLVELRLEQKIISDQLMDVQKRLWTLEERNHPEADCRNWKDKRDREQYKELKETLDALKLKQRGLIK